MTRTLAHDLAGKRIRYRAGTRRRTGRVVSDRNKWLDVDTGSAKTTPVRRQHVEEVLPDPVSTTGTIARPFTHERPLDCSKLPRQMTQAAGRGLPQRTGGVSERYRRWVRTLPCAWCGAAPPSDANHEPRRGMSGGKRDDLNVMPLCSGVGGCHDTVTRTGRLGNMGPEDTKTWMRERIMDLLKAWIRAA